MTIVNYAQKGRSSTQKYFLRFRWFPHLLHNIWSFHLRLSERSANQRNQYFSTDYLSSVRMCTYSCVNICVTDYSQKIDRCVLWFSAKLCRSIQQLFAILIELHYVFLCFLAFANKHVLRISRLSGYLSACSTRYFNFKNHFSSCLCHILDFSGFRHWDVKYVSFVENEHTEREAFYPAVRFHSECLKRHKILYVRDCKMTKRPIMPSIYRHLRDTLIKCRCARMNRSHGFMIQIAHFPVGVRTKFRTKFVSCQIHMIQ